MSTRRPCPFCWILRYLVAVAALLAGLWFWQRHHPAPLDLAALNNELQAGTALPADFRRVPTSTLLDDNGQPVPARSLFEGRWTLVFFGYTWCPDICPATLAMMGQLARTLRESHPAIADTEVLFVSVDPGRDDPERLAEYVRYFDPAFRATTGDKAAIDELTAELGIVYRLVGDTSTDDYLVDHSGTVALIDPAARLRGLFSPPLRPAAMAADLAALRAALAGESS